MGGGGEQGLVGLNIKELIWRVGGRVWHGVGGTGSWRELGEQGLAGVGGTGSGRKLGAQGLVVSWRVRVW
jgi:hypothetical protein